jgi:hypothetical protein
MEEADPPPPPNRGWTADTQFMNKVDKISEALKIIHYIHGVVLNGLKNIDQDGIAMTEEASRKIDEMASKTAEYFPYVQPVDKRKFIH